MPGGFPILAKRLALVLAGLLLGCCLSEALLRVFKPDLNFKFFTKGANEEELVRRRNSHYSADHTTYTFDADGFRIGSGLPYDKTVLFVGDSFTRGEKVRDDQTFARVAEKTLREKGIQARTLNAGMQGMGGAHELRILRGMLDKFQVDAAVLEVFPGNDLMDNYTDGGFGIEDGRLVEYNPPRKPLRIRIREALCFNSPVSDLLIFRGLANLLVPDHFFDGSLDGPYPFDLERALLAESVATARRHGVPLLIVTVANFGPLPPGVFFPDNPDRFRFKYEWISGMAAGLGVPYLDLRGEIHDETKDFINGDGHYSVVGNQRVGAAIADALVPLLSKKAPVAAVP